MTRLQINSYCIAFIYSLVQQLPLKDILQLLKNIHEVFLSQEFDRFYLLSFIEKILFEKNEKNRNNIPF